MTEKRFIPIFDGTDKRVVGAKDNGKIISFMDMFDLLNDLSDENEQLRKENDMFSCELSVSANKEISRNCRIAELEEENEQLKQFKEKIFTSIEKEIARNEKTIEWKKETLDLLNEFYEINKKLHDENEELKKENEFLKRICNEDYRNLRRAYRMATKKR